MKLYRHLISQLHPGMILQNTENTVVFKNIILQIIEISIIFIFQHKAIDTTDVFVIKNQNLFACICVSDVVGHVSKGWC